MHKITKKKDMFKEKDKEKKASLCMKRDLPYFSVYR